MKQGGEEARSRLEGREEPPPFWGAWWRVYAGVLAWLAFLIALFAWFSRRFAP